MDKVKLLLLSVLSGLLFAFAWPAIGGIPFVIFYAFLPLLWVEHELSKKEGATGLKVFSHAYLGFFVFNLLTTWWIYYASDWGAAMAIICNSLFMATVFWLYHITRIKVGKKEGYISLIIYWLAFEYLHLNWELSWTWLTFGNVFADSIKSIQWYEYTGVLGGSLLVLVVNVLFFKSFLYKNVNKKRYYINMALGFFLVFASIIISRIQFANYEENGKEIEAVIIQPNIDPYFDKFSGMADSEQIDRMVQQTKENVTDKTAVVILPETAFPTPSWEHDLEFMYGTEEFRKIIQNYPNLRVITGILASKLYVDDTDLSPTAKKLPGKGYYDNFNAAIQLDSSEEIAIHRKSKLVLGGEKIPFMKTFPFLKRLSISLGGTTGRYGTQDKPTVFFDKTEKKGIAPIICYESIYGEYVNQYAQQGAELYAIITNDGWWDDTPGFRQHLAYARLRAIENRRAIIRSANTGVSAIITAKGEVTDQTEWWEQTVLKGNVKLNDEITFYVKYGDYIGRVAALLAPLILLLVLVKTLNKTEQRLQFKKP